MKKVLCIAIFAMWLGVANANPGFVLSIRPNRILEGFGLGLHLNKFVPEFGVDIANASFSSTMSFQTPDETYEYKANTNATVIVPHLGLKYFFVTNALRPYLGFSFLYTFGTASVTFDGEADENFEEWIKDALSGNLGIGLCFGGEYFVSKNFSINGSAGFKYYHGSVDMRYEYSPGYIDIFKNALGLGISDVNWGLNFYF